MNLRSLEIRVDAIYAPISTKLILENTSICNPNKIRSVVATFKKKRIHENLLLKLSTHIQVY
jgi:hypothetical protein